MVPKWLLLHLLKAIKYILFPISIVYGIITWLRNKLYETRLFKSSSFDVPIICVGNLSMGGTGKTPHVEYLIRILQNDYKLATLSRGYGRKTSGFILAEEEDNANTIGDEPMQYFRKFPKIKVAVEKRRVMGILFIMNQAEDREVVVLDDAFQHRALKAGLNILLTDFSNPFYKDLILPTGELREFRSGVNRADIVIVTKCPSDLDQARMNKIKERIKFERSNIFFTSITYRSIYSGYQPKKIIENILDFEVLLVTGIAKPKSIEKYLSEQGVNFESIHFGDHYKFKKKDVLTISKKIGTFEGSKKIILTTEKDFSRMLTVKEFKGLPIYCLEIEIKFLSGGEINFDEKVKHYVSTNKRDIEIPSGEN